MKIDIVKSFFAVVISALLAFTCYEICSHANYKNFIATASFITIGITAVLTFGVSAKQERSSMMLKALSSTTFFIEIATNVIFALFKFSTPAYIIINGLILVVFALIYSSIYKTKM